MNFRPLPLALAFALAGVRAEAASDHWKFAPVPPMGWNSWDCFGTTITEAQAKAQADAMARQLKPFGWTYFTVDIQWYEPHSQGHGYKEGAPLAMDTYSRLIPATTKFPSAANNEGFKPLAEYIHSKGLKFGIHLMRGIPKQAVRQNTPILATTARAAEIANPRSTCPWNPDMFGVDLSKPGAQAYYDSLFQLYASWGVDLVKVDDIARPYDDGQKAEIEAIRQAIDRTGRPIVLSLSPGDTPLSQGDHVMNHANMWRISDDFWDRWAPLHEMFGRLDAWTRYRAGAWPDADMLPFGIIEFSRPTKFTREEQLLCMTLWCIARSPLILGADMTKLDEFTLKLLTNPEVLAVNQASTGNRQLSRDDDLVVWTAAVPDSPDRYVALFNAQGSSLPYDLRKALYRSSVLRKDNEVAEISVSVKGARKLALVVTDGGDNIFFDHADWIEPTLTGSKGELKLVEQKWTYAKAGYGEVRVNVTSEGKPVMLDGRVVDGIGTHAVSLIEFEIPEGYERFTARGVLSHSRPKKEGSVEFIVLTDAARLQIPDKTEVSIAFADLGISGKAQVRDLWNRRDLGTFTNRFGREIPVHSAGLFRVTPQP
jgi:alpha-galactosidase